VVGKKDWTDKIVNKGGAAASFLQPFTEDKTEGENGHNVTGNNGEQTGDNPDYLDKLLEDGKQKNDLHLTGLYLEPDLAKLLDQLGKKGGRGAKSRIANDALRKYFLDKGLM
jgi:protein involved in sex pheromone biosynthesis